MMDGLVGFEVDMVISLSTLDPSCLLCLLAYKRKGASRFRVPLPEVSKDYLSSTVLCP